LPIPQLCRGQHPYLGKPVIEIDHRDKSLVGQSVEDLLGVAGGTVHPGGPAPHAAVQGDGVAVTNKPPQPGKDQEGNRHIAEAGFHRFRHPGVVDAPVVIAGGV
jgi:hypothetical protein